MPLASPRKAIPAIYGIAANDSWRTRRNAADIKQVSSRYQLVQAADSAMDRAKYGSNCDRR